VAEAREYRQRPFALPEGATQVILVRHGASAPVVEGETHPLVGGRSDPGLAPEGREHAEAVRRALEPVPFARLFATPLRRTLQTAAPLAAAVGMEPEIVEDLVEVHLGEWEGGEYRIRMQRRDPEAIRVLLGERYDLIPGAEPAASLAARVKAGIEHVVRETGPDATAVAVVHGGVIGETLRQASGSRPFAFIFGENGSISRLVVHPQWGWRVRTFNEVAHLAE
jgi:probable phosphoglycerate mutase